MAIRKPILNKDIVKEKLIAAGVPYPEEKVKELDKIVAKYMRNMINAAKEKEDAQYDEAISFHEVYPEYDLSQLPFLGKR